MSKIQKQMVFVKLWWLLPLLLEFTTHRSDSSQKSADYKEEAVCYYRTQLVPDSLKVFISQVLAAVKWKNLQWIGS